MFDFAVAKLHIFGEIRYKMQEKINKIMQICIIPHFFACKYNNS